MTRWLAFLSILLVPLLLGGCDTKHKHAYRTPNGWWINWQDQGTVASGRHTLPQLAELFDAAMVRGQEFVVKTYGVPAGEVESRLRSNDAEYTLIDDYRFPVIGGPAADAPNAVFATGETMNRFTVYIAFYNEHNENKGLKSDVPQCAIPWTVRQNPANGFWYWGEEDEGNQYPALGYELHWQFTNAP